MGIWILQSHRQLAGVDRSRIGRWNAWVGVLIRIIRDDTLRVLTENLRSLECDGYLRHDVDPGPAIAVRYMLTDLREELLPLLRGLIEWAARRHAVLT